MNSANNHKLSYNRSLSFEDVSKLFSLPLSEAADILGVSTSVLKKLRNDNGLERWPHLKYLARKSIEDIKKEAVREKSKASGEISEAKDWKRSVITWKHHALASSLTSDTPSCLDEVKYGFLSSGLSRSTNKWWGSGSDNHDLKSGSEVKHVSETELDVSSSSVCEEKPNSSTVDSPSDVQERVSLSSFKKRTLDEEQKALKLVVKKYEVDKLGREEETLSAGY